MLTEEKTLNMIEEFAKLIPAELKDLSGAVFYSGRNAFQGKKVLYIIGLNPGGSEEKQKDSTIFWHTEETLTKKSADWSEYTDEFWGGPLRGGSGLQPRIRHLLNKLNLSPNEVPASNICFVRSSREKMISDKLSYYTELCWPFHEKVINDLEIKVILCFGKRAGSIVRNKIHANIYMDHFVEQNNRKWETQVYKNTKGQIVIVATHPSIADWTNPKTDPSEVVKKYFPVQ
jgi:hypothetical protein